MIRWLKTWGPWILIGVCALFFADEALAQSTGGSFGGGNFGGGGGGGGGGGYSGGGDDGGDGLITFIIYVLLSRLPWPFKIALVGGAIGIFAAVKIVKNKNKKKNDDQDPPPPGGMIP